MTVYVFDKDGKRIFWQGLEMDIRKLSADEDLTGSVSIPYADEIRDDHIIRGKCIDYE